MADAKRRQWTLTKEAKKIKQENEQARSKTRVIKAASSVERALAPWRTWRRTAVGQKARSSNEQCLQHNNFPKMTQ